MHDRAYFGDKMNSMIWKLAPAIVSLVAYVLIVYLQAQRGGKIHYAIDRGDGRVEFPPDLVAAFLSFAVATLYSAWMVINNFARHGSGNLLDGFALAALLFATGLVLFSLPGTVVVGPGGIEKRFWLRAEKLIRWGQTNARQAN